MVHGKFIAKKVYEPPRFTSPLGGITLYQRRELDKFVDSQSHVLRGHLRGQCFSLGKKSVGKKSEQMWWFFEIGEPRPSARNEIPLE